MPQRQHRMAMKGDGVYMLIRKKYSLNTFFYYVQLQKFLLAHFDVRFICSMADVQSVFSLCPHTHTVQNLRSNVLHRRPGSFL